ncbi:uroporphyrinogen-III synthase [Oceanobacillus alkalisoli]|uniref:uroporphyrinogen-III synthase n=1 Tax=Oceanobacillus alkalisoli TaxID=2925113 RepID=UPI001EF0D9C0|nr:uroporphyrinogen-III synthase [Oceanobacillus alkalisoli]MCF3941903.1 uroporphyrinogen-III synthase [Oceanobacillus alkalisoli]MCG5104278.1 uroporphyrinogen-III synthase [Oceanobacillus alkalisoli]
MSSDLQGKRIIVTREAGQAKSFSDKIRELGGVPIEIPLLRINCISPNNEQDIFNQLQSYHWIIFTSANGVNCFFAASDKNQGCFREQVKIAAVGHKTDLALRRFGYTADLVPDTYDAETLSAIFLPIHQNGERILLVRGSRSLDVLPKRLGEKGIAFDSIEIYETNINEEIKDRLTHVVQQGAFDYLTFTSPSTVNGFIDLYGKAVSAPCVCIGTTTEKAASAAGFTHLITAKTFTIEGMLEAMMIQD